MTTSFFGKSRLPLKKWVTLIYWWACRYPVTDAAAEAEVDDGTAIDVYRWLHKICTSAVLRTPIVFMWQWHCCTDI